ncbi:retrovirus-related pol polyprotein from transposon TNT 1-94 [Tanacetum coccineum]
MYFEKNVNNIMKYNDLKAQMQDKNIAISELKKLIEKCKGKSVETQFDKPSVVRQPNAQRIPKPSVLGKPTPFSNSPKMRSFQNKTVVNKTNVSDGLFNTRPHQNFASDIRKQRTYTRIYLNDVNARTKKPKLPNIKHGFGIEDFLHPKLRLHPPYYSKKDIVTGLPKLTYVKDQLCSSCEMSKAKKSSFKSKAVPSSKGRLNLLHMDLCGPMRVCKHKWEEIYLVLLDDYSRYTWTLFLQSKDEKHLKFSKTVITMIHASSSSQPVPQGQKASDFDKLDPCPKTKCFHYNREDKFVTTRVGISLRPLLKNITIQTRSLLTDNNNDQSTNASFQEDVFINPFCTWVQEIVQTRRQLAKDPENVMFALTVLKVMLKEEGIYLKKSFAPVARLEAVRIFVATAHKSFQSISMDVIPHFLKVHLEGGGSLLLSQKTGYSSLGDKLVSWMSKKQNCTAMSSAEVEYVALSASCAQSRVRMRFVEEEERDLGHVEIQKERWEKKGKTRSKEELNYERHHTKPGRGSRMKARKPCKRFVLYYHDIRFNGTNAANATSAAAVNHTQLDSHYKEEEFEGRQNSLAAGITRTYTPGASGSNSGKQMIVICYNCKGEGHMSKQCTKPKRKQDDSWILGVALMANLSHYGSDALAEYVIESQQAAVQNSNPSAQQDALILSVIEQLKNQLEPKIYDGNVIKNTSAIMIPDSEETLLLAEESSSKMILKQQDPMMLEKKVNTTPVNYAVLIQLSQDFEKRFVPQTKLSVEQSFWSQNFCVIL